MAEHQTPTTTHDPEAVAKVRDVMSDIDVAMVTTHDHESPGRLVSRPLSTQTAEDGDALFLIRVDSSVADDVRANPQVNLSYTSASAWLSVAGSAEIVTDNALVADRWSTGAKAFMEGGPEDPENVVLRVRGSSAHLWGGDGVLGAVVSTLKAIAGRDGDDDSSTVVDLGGDGGSGAAVDSPTPRASS